jgi:hypothetical protein
VAGTVLHPPVQAGLEAFFQTVADASSVPLILYDIPYRTGVTFEQATLLNIVAHERIVAIKDCGGNLTSTLALLSSGLVDVLWAKTTRFSAPCAWVPAGPSRRRRTFIRNCSSSCINRYATTNWPPGG